MQSAVAIMLSKHMCKSIHMQSAVAIMLSNHICKSIQSSGLLRYFVTHFYDLWKQSFWG